MKLERILPGEYRAQREDSMGIIHIWVFRRRRKWYWTTGGYSGFNEWLVEPKGPFSTRRHAVTHAIEYFKYRGITHWV